MESGRDRMDALAALCRPRSSLALALSALLWAACGGESEKFVTAGKASDAGTESDRASMDEPSHGCDRVEMDGEFVLEHEKDFTGRFRVGEPYSKTVMLFGGEPVEDDNVLSNAQIFGLDKMDALMLAEKYPDFYLCSSVGGQEASKYIVPYDLVPASCEVYEQIVAALRTYHKSVVAGGDRTSLRLHGAPLELESVIADATGENVTDQVTNQNFHLVSAVEQLTGQSVLEFGKSK